MAKSKNHTNHNQSYKNHRNGIKGLPNNKYISNKGVNSRLLKNTRRARKFDPTIKKQANLAKRIMVLKANKTQILKLLKDKEVKRAQKKVTKEVKPETKKAAKKK